MTKRIKYICYYDKYDSPQKRNYVLSSTNKLNYIFSAFNSNGIGVDVISASGCIEAKLVYDSGRIIADGMNTICLFLSFGCKKIAPLRVLDRWFMHIQLFLYILCKVKHNEEVIVYHSLGYVKLLLLAQKIKKFRIIGEIEEIYQDVTRVSPSLCRAEYRFIHCCDKYIFPTSLLNEKLNVTEKPHLIIHGTYQVGEDMRVKFDDDKIHVVYAGTFDPNKGGAAAAAAAAFLPAKYHLHILGFGTEKDTADIKQIISDTAAESASTLTFDGLLKGEEYIRFIQKCHIGLSTQNPDAAFNATSFPSKILSYMGNGLRVASIRIEAIEKSDVGNYIYYYDRQTPEDIAKAILEVDMSDSYDSMKIIGSLDEKFKCELKRFMACN